MLIAEDEEAARRRLRRFLEREPGVTLVGACSSSTEAADAVEALSPDLVLLDIRIPPGSGFDVLDRLGREARTAVVFVTADERYAVRAFEAGAVDFLLKPYSEARLRSALERVRAWLHRPDAPAAAPPAAPNGNGSARGHRRLVLKTGSELVFVDPDEVDWIEAEGVYVRFHVGKKSYLLRETLANVEQRLDPERFLRIHRSTILNVDRAVKIVPHFNGGALVHLADGARLKMSRGYRDRVRATLG
ncbi:MAG: LytTR family DNA-binding domain-containing protein [Rhodothermales bacterium]|nr:LytTR family DNA-binding domain-containing protein [Rhodothermales bacterium]